MYRESLEKLDYMYLVLTKITMFYTESSIAEKSINTLFTL